MFKSKNSILNMKNSSKLKYPENKKLDIKIGDYKFTSNYHTENTSSSLGNTLKDRGK